MLLKASSESTGDRCDIKSTMWRHAKMNMMNNIQGYLSSPKQSTFTA